MGKSEYRDYPCYNSCGCDTIPERDKPVINRYHFHYRDTDNNIQWCCVISNISEETLPLADFSALSQPLREINYMLENTYYKPTSIFRTLLLAAYTPRSFTLQQFSLQLQSLLVAREHFRKSPRPSITFLPLQRISSTSKFADVASRNTSGLCQTCPAQS